ncbi:MAG TPA: Lrp/AsnC family transcriptional regulator [Clostridiaceae bacterium]|jgi:Lrp/AsnC family leucine-responsive transcriptional regulator|nr:Lrp/AsnC family transcriptional regulator [Clostridiaceae bacterium]
MDEIDKQIMHILSKNSRISATDLAPLIGLSVPATNKRIQKLQENGIIECFTIIPNAEKLSKTLIAFIFVTINRFSEFPKLIEHVKSKIDILECYAITGDFDYILRVCAKDTACLEQMLMELKNLDVVVKTNTVIVLYKHKYEPVILPDLNGS